MEIKINSSITQDHACSWSTSIVVFGHEVAIAELMANHQVKHWLGS